MCIWRVGNRIFPIHNKTQTGFSLVFTNYQSTLFWYSSDIEMKVPLEFFFHTD